MAAGLSPPSSTPFLFRCPFPLALLCLHFCRLTFFSPLSFFSLLAVKISMIDLLPRRLLELCSPPMPLPALSPLSPISPRDSPGSWRRRPPPTGFRILISSPAPGPPRGTAPGRPFFPLRASRSRRSLRRSSAW